MSKLTTLLVAASLSGAVATTTAIVASRNNNRTENVEYLRSEDNAKSEILKFSNSETGVIDVDAIRQSKEVSPIVSPGRTYSGGNVSNEDPDAIAVALGPSPLDAKHGTASSMAQDGYMLTSSNKGGAVAGSVLTSAAMSDFVPSSAGGGASGGATLAMAVASSRMAASNYTGGGSGFVAISRKNREAQTPIMAAPENHSTYTSPPPPWVVNPSDRLPLDGAWWMLMLTAVAYALVKMVRRRSVK